MTTPTQNMPASEHEVPQTGKVGRVLVPIGLGGLVLLVVAAVVVLGVIPRRAARAELERREQAREASAPGVLVVTAVAGPPVTTLRLPARADALQETSLFPREGGYIKELNVDLGDHVKAGQVLAVIETPVLDQQLLEAQASIAVAEARRLEAAAQADQSNTTLKRLESIGDVRAVSAQAIDDARAKAKVDEASRDAAAAFVESARVTRRRLDEQKGLGSIRAPFDGEVTQRTYDLGALVVADKTDANRPLFRITNRDELRVFSQVPQSAAMAIEPGQEVSVLIREWPGREFKGKVVRASASLDAAAKTRLVEARIANPGHELLPGMFVECVFTIPRKAPSVVLPGEAMLIRDGKTMVAVVTPESTLDYRAIEIDRDLGSTVEVSVGVKAGETVVVNMARQLEQGATVKATPRKQ